LPQKKSQPRRHNDTKGEEGSRRAREQGEGIADCRTQIAEVRVLGFNLHFAV
jgi:hypothetical protein